MDTSFCWRKSQKLKLKFEHFFSGYFFFAIVFFSPLTSPSPHLQPGGLLASSDGVVLEGELVLPDDGSAVLVSDVRHYVHVRRPHLKLSLPVDDGGEGRTDQERPFGVTLDEETGHQCKTSYRDAGHLCPRPTGPNSMPENLVNNHSCK